MRQCLYSIFKSSSSLALSDTFSEVGLGEANVSSQSSKLSIEVMSFLVDDICLAMDLIVVPCQTIIQFLMYFNLELIFLQISLP